MGTIQQNKLANRRDFLGKLAGTAALLGISHLPLTATAEVSQNAPSATKDLSDPDEWLKSNVKGKHKIVFDAVEPKEIFAFAWPKVFLMTNQGTGSTEKDCSVVVVCRHNSVVYAVGDPIWEKYKLGEMFKINDPRTGAPATRNPFLETKPDDFKVPGIGAVPLGIRDLQASGVLFCCCNVALTVYSAVAAMKTNQDAAAVNKEWVAGVIPSVQIMPSGVWAVGRAQEYGCTYCYVG